MKKKFELGQKNSAVANYNSVGISEQSIGAKN
jgi:hypothetical protein